MKAFFLACAAVLAPVTLIALGAEVLSSKDAIPAHIAGRFRDARGFQQSAFGQFFVFDRRGHRVYGVDEARQSVWQIVQLGPEEGNIIDPTGFSLAPDGTFVVADMPQKTERIQVFTPVGFRITGFILPGERRVHITFNDVILNGIGSLQYTGSSILISQPENGSLVTEYAPNGRTIRTFGQLRPTGHEDDRDVHVALNSGIPLAIPGGGYLFVFQSGLPVFRKYDAEGRLLFERHIEGREIDETIARLPTTWPRRKDNTEFALVAPTIRTAAVDREGNLWVSFVTPFTYVYDRDGDKIRTVQFRGAGLISPTSLFFSPKSGLLVTPGLLEF